MGTFSKAQEYKLQLNTILIIPIMIHEFFLNGLNEARDRISSPPPLKLGNITQAIFPSFQTLRPLR